MIELPIPDTYTRRARIVPAMLVGLPIVIAWLAWVPEAADTWETLGGAVVGAGLVAVLGQVGRDMGKRKEPGLFKAWGGKPTLQLLRRSGVLSASHRARYHRAIEHTCVGLDLPSEEQENADQRWADGVYEAATSALIAKTRDRQAFPLIFEENCNYGFRRNLWGMKPLGLTIATAGSGAAAWLLAAGLQHGEAVSSLQVASLALNASLSLMWLWVTPKWVRIPADAYADRLLEASEILSSAAQQRGMRRKRQVPSSGPRDV